MVVWTVRTVASACTPLWPVAPLLLQQAVSPSARGEFWVSLGTKTRRRRKRFEEGARDCRTGACCKSVAYPPAYAVCVCLQRDPSLLCTFVNTYIWLRRLQGTVVASRRCSQIRVGQRDDRCNVTHRDTTRSKGRTRVVCLPFVRVSCASWLV
jgi:hypothetical protein